MNNFINLLNQNQGILAAVAIGLTILGGIFTWFAKRKKIESAYINSPHVSESNIHAQGDITVGHNNTKFGRYS